MKQGVHESGWWRPHMLGMYAVTRMVLGWSRIESRCAIIHDNTKWLHVKLCKQAEVYIRWCWDTFFFSIPHFRHDLSPVTVIAPAVSIIPSRDTVTQRWFPSQSLALKPSSRSSMFGTSRSLSVKRTNMVYGTSDDICSTTTLYPRPLAMR
jgi:hypothetical protein